MSLFIVDHEYGVTIVSARSARAAADIGDRYGGVIAVYPYRGELNVHLGRAALPDPEDGHLDLACEIADDTDEIEAAIAKHNLTFSREEYAAKGPSRP